MMLGKKIKTFLNQRGIRQNFICEKTGLSAQTVSAMLNGDRKITAEEYFLICEALNVKADFFIETAESA
ncbi:MAG: helix-turn-helix domain-containing protein [Eubacterium sp.]|nr:helix-turn-helix domain-containing protein [Eubacterium sp.]